MKYLKYILTTILFFLSTSIICELNTTTSPQSFDTLYRMTPATYITHHLMHIWQDIQHVAYEPVSDDYIYYEIIGHIMHLYDVIENCVIMQQWHFFSEDTLCYWLYTIECMIEDAHILQIQGRILLYKSVIQALNKLWNIINS